MISVEIYVESKDISDGNDRLMAALRVSGLKATIESIEIEDEMEDMEGEE